LYCRKALEAPGAFSLYLSAVTVVEWGCGGRRAGMSNQNRETIAQERALASSLLLACTLRFGDAVFWLRVFCAGKARRTAA
jgi:hypothetical protein